jgi:prophage regulatory protein
MAPKLQSDLMRGPGTLAPTPDIPVMPARPGDPRSSRGPPPDSLESRMRVLCFSDLRALKGIPWSRAHVWRLVRAGHFPAPLKLGLGTNGWLSGEIDDWIAARAAERSTNVA